MNKNSINYPITVFSNTYSSQLIKISKVAYNQFIYIKHGNGYFINNNISRAFTNGQMFLLKEGYEHTLEFTEETKLYAIQFTHQARLVLKDLTDNSNGRSMPPLKAKSPLTSVIAVTETDEVFIENLLVYMISLCEQPLLNENILYYQTLCVFNMVERNLSFTAVNKTEINPLNSFKPILKHIHKNLYDPEMLTLSYIANKFNMTNNRLGLLFKEQMNSSVKQYIQQCRMQLIADQVKNSSATFSEIAIKFGFVDESHFYKSFKKHFGKSPSVYKTTT